jgi:hypothetical protein
VQRGSLFFGWLFEVVFLNQSYADDRFSKKVMKKVEVFLSIMYWQLKKKFSTRVDD